MKKPVVCLVVLITFLPSISAAQVPFGGQDAFRFPNPEDPGFCGCVPSPLSGFPTITFIPPSGPIVCTPPTPPIVPTLNFFDFFFGYSTGFFAVPLTPLLFPSYTVAPGAYALGFMTPVSPVCGLIIPFEIPDSVGCGPFLCLPMTIPVVGTVTPNTGSTPPSLEL